MITDSVHLERVCGDFPGGTVDKDPSAKAGDMGSSPAQEYSTGRRARKPMSPNYWVRMLQLPKPACLGPVLCNKGRHQNEKPTQHSEEKPLLTTKKAQAKQRRSSAAKNK